MNYKRAIVFGVVLWVFIFVVVSVLMFLPLLQGKQMLQDILFWLALIPLALILAKWHFLKDIPSVKNGLLLGVIALLVGTLLDVLITVPLFVKSYVSFYGDWTLYVGYLETLLLCLLAGGEFDVTFFKKEEGIDKS